MDAHFSVETDKEGVADNRNRSTVHLWGQFIRTMSFKIGRHEAALSCETKTTPLKLLEEALSYAWGSANPPTEISFDSSLSLRPNLASALRRLPKFLQHQIFGLVIYASIKRIHANLDCQKIQYKVYEGAKEVSRGSVKELRQVTS